MKASARKTYLVLWTATAAGALLALLGGAVLPRVGAPSDALKASAATAESLLWHNLSVALWPLALIVLGWASIPVIRRVGDVLAVAQLAVHGLLVGNALGQQPALWRFLPHLPFEWLGIALPVAAWRVARVGVAPNVARVAAVVCAALVVAAGLETWAVPL